MYISYIVCFALFFLGFAQNLCISLYRKQCFFLLIYRKYPFLSCILPSISYIYKHSFFFVLWPDALYIYFSIGGFLYIYGIIPFFYLFCPDLLLFPIYIVNFCILPRLIYIVLETSLFLFIYFAQNLGVFLFRFL